MSPLRLLFCFCVYVCATGCATMVSSIDLQEKVNFERERRITRPLQILFKRTLKWGDREARQEPFDESSFAIEIDTIKKSNIFENPVFEESHASHEPFIEFKISRYWNTDGCYMGGCLFIPGYRISQYSVLMTVYNSENEKIFEHSESITGEERKAGLDFSLGMNPIDSIRTKGLPLLIDRCLVKFVNSEVFKKLTESRK